MQAGTQRARLENLPRIVADSLCKRLFARASATINNENMRKQKRAYYINKLFSHFIVFPLSSSIFQVSPRALAPITHEQTAAAHG